MVAACHSYRLDDGVLIIVEVERIGVVAFTRQEYSLWKLWPFESI